MTGPHPVPGQPGLQPVDRKFLILKTSGLNNAWPRPVFKETAGNAKQLRFNSNILPEHPNLHV
ncbi:hypothetical protein GCM10019059_45340 [Camelimonas fluminis]|nr:hypothetical protein GCM10019059_45340 [Camelimonas fluminis]